jgi:outer membrane murein-binding lipoprotein Lpp
MRRHTVLLAATVVGLVVISGCSSDSSTRRTVTAVVTVSSGADVSGSADPSGSGSADASASGSESAASPSRSPSPSASPTAAPIVAVDPLKVDCAAILNAADVKKVINADIPNDRLKVTVAEVNTDAGQTGRIRCLYGLSGDKKTGAITLALTQYADPSAAQKQVDVTIQNETDNNAQIIPTTVQGYPATIAIRDGGLIIMPYDTWTMAIAVDATNGPDPAVLAIGLPQLADAALTRILKA